MFANLLRYRSYRYLWWALGSVAVGWVVYGTHGGGEPPNGGTWQGYVLGSWATVLIVWLGLLGWRKRRYRSGAGTTQGWTSAHVYLGLAVWVLATLHCGAQLGLNVHTLAYLLMSAVIVSGVAGLYLYLNYPLRLAHNNGGHHRSELFAELYELNGQGLELAGRCAADVQTAVRSAIERTRLGGGVVAQLSGRDTSSFDTLEHGYRANADQAAVIEAVAGRITRANKRSEVADLQDLLSVLCRRQAVLRRLREDIRLKGWLNAWLYAHVPLTVATVAALIAHVVSTFVYW
jgi:hypothetical protein